MRSHFNTLDRISKRIQNQLRNIQLEFPTRFKRGILNGVGSIWKAITGNLDASDGEYFNQCIDKLEKDDAAIQALLRSQINIVSTTIKNFNNTVRNLQIDELTLNQDLEKIQNSINNATNERQFLKDQIQVINMFENLLESYVLIENEVNDITDSLTFSKLQILHPSVIKSDTLIEQLVLISRQLEHNNLPLRPNVQNLPGLINLITLKAFQNEKRLVFILQIPLVSNEQYTSYHLYSIPTRDLNSDLFHAIIPESKYIGLSKDNRQYLRISNLDQCKEIATGTSLCKNMVPLAIESAPCEIEVITKLSTKACKPVLMRFKDYNVVKLKKNKWIVILSKVMPIVHTCPQQMTKTQLVEANSILSMQPACTAYIGSTQIYAQEEKSSNYTEHDVIPQVPFDCCEDVAKNMQVTLNPIKLNSINLDELDTASHKLSEQEDLLNQLNTESFAGKHLGTFTIITIVAILLIFSYCICCKCGLFRKLIGYMKPSGGDDSPPNCCIQLFNYCTVSSPVSKRNSYRASMHSLEETNYQSEATASPLANLGANARRSTHTTKKF